MQYDDATSAMGWRGFGMVSLVVEAISVTSEGEFVLDSQKGSPSRDDLDFKGGSGGGRASRRESGRASRRSQDGRGGRESGRSQDCGRKIWKVSK